MSNKLELLTMQLIMNSGNAKSLAMESIVCARENKIEIANEKIKQAEEAICKAHEIQTELLTQEARGVDYSFSLLLTHSQDHLMNAINAIDIAKEMILLWVEVYKNKED